ncbi:MAG: hypothetical protein P3W93_008850 [Thermus sp.]|nr:hypothetical protein [Thermus sp.]
MERILIFKTEDQVTAFSKALAKAVPGEFRAERDTGWTLPALKVDGVTLGQILAAATWAGYEPVHVVE